MVCWQQGKHDLTPHLYRESCRLYPPQQALSIYADKTDMSLGVHTCVSEPGSSGCPLIYQVDDKTYLAGIQIEGDSLTGAGIGRLYTNGFQSSVESVIIGE